MSESFDVIVCGGGTAGAAAAITLPSGSHPAMPSVQHRSVGNSRPSLNILLTSSAG